MSEKEGNILRYLEKTVIVWYDFNIFDWAFISELSGMTSTYYQWSKVFFRVELVNDFCFLIDSWTGFHISVAYENELSFLFFYP